MQIEQNRVVSLTYKLTNHKTGEKIEETSADQPMVFLVGAGQLIPDFENNLQGKKAGDSFSFSIASDLAYGSHSEEQIVSIPSTVFHDEAGKFDAEYFRVGALIPMSDNEGNQLRGKILDVSPETVKMDFNHPLAGTDLQFEGKILEVREATEDEIAHGHVHGPGGHHH
ncbi:MAG: peptidylprolyl isomerase FKBP-type [Crocinitomicaceae bacterium]|jgi:FKBP-type peptidyl-prolyl cis-trans isomerase SlyD|nr:peptidylprolyl isomerase FKBP-type [Crocinitomicaceae bacterium]